MCDLERVKFRISLKNIILVSMAFISMAFIVGTFYIKICNASELSLENHSQIEALKQGQAEIKTDVKWIKGFLIDIKGQVR